MPKQRIAEIDFLRTIALILMILFHFIYDLDQWTSVPIDISSPFWFVVGKISALLFIFLSGISSGLSTHPVKNGVRVLLWGLIITAVTRVALPEEYVRFGILHLLGTMMILYPFLKRLPDLILLIGIALAFGLGLYFSHQVANTFWFVPFGITYNGFKTIDFYPLFPYSGITLLGILSYRHYYQKLLSHGEKQPRSVWNSISFFNLPIFQQTSRHSLWIYLIHQPILLLIIFSFTKLFT